MEGLDAGKEVQAKEIVHFMDQEKGIPKKRTYEIIREALETEIITRRKEGRTSFYSPVKRSVSFRNESEVSQGDGLPSWATIP